MNKIEKDWELRKIGCEIISRLPSDPWDALRVVEFCRDILLNPRAVPLDEERAPAPLRIINGD